LLSSAAGAPFFPFLAYSHFVESLACAKPRKTLLIAGLFGYLQKGFVDGVGGTGMELIKNGAAVLYKPTAAVNGFLSVRAILGRSAGIPGT
jgi:hypothetical protein